MIFRLREFLYQISILSIYKRKLILKALDFGIIFFSIYGSYWLLNPAVEKTSFNLNVFIYLILQSFIGIFIYQKFGKYKSLTKFNNSKLIYYLFLQNTFFIFCVSILNSILNFIVLDIKNIINLWILLNTLSASIKVIQRDLIINIENLSLSSNAKSKLKNIVIYGTSITACQLSKSFEGEGKFNVLFFIDEDPNLWIRKIQDKEIKSIDSLKEYRKSIDYILIALPSFNQNQINNMKIIHKLKKYNIPLISLPSLKELTIDRNDSLRDIDIDEEDLLQRNSVKVNNDLLEKDIKEKIICVTGAGGSIGTELCKQIIHLKPKKLIIFDHSEINLYSLREDLLRSNKYSVEIVSELGTALNETLLDNLFSRENIDIVFHAAAYKHVPIVESNPFSGLENNILSSLNICNSARASKVKKVLLISSDKAVRPTNLMGVSKRISELIFEAYDKNEKKLINKLENEKKKYSIVRFGNVLGSSGSVIPLFKRQIKFGGPITITHPEVTRFFMSVREAVQLVLHTSLMMNGGEVFLLDMGKPIKILSLAEQMILKSGFTIKNKENINGDIEIISIGLRPGEKLYEELLINSKSIKTRHPAIYMAKDEFKNENNILLKLEELKKYLKNQDKKNLFKLLKEIVPEWSS